MLGLTALTTQPIPSPSNSTSKPLFTPASHHKHTHFSFSSSSLHKPQTRISIRRKPNRFVVLANSDNGLNQESKEKEKERGKEEGIGSDGVDDDDDLKKNEGTSFGDIRWGDLLLDPDPNNVLAVGLTGLLTWASVQVLWQLLFIALAILVAAVKYSFIAAVLLFILITLL